MLQWIGERPAQDYKLIMRTFLDVFPNATLWLNGSLLVGSKRPFHLDPDALSRRRNNPVTARALDEIGLTSDDVLRSWYTGGPNEMRRYVAGGPLLTDDQPLLEFTGRWLTTTRRSTTARFAATSGRLRTDRSVGRGLLAFSRSV